MTQEINATIRGKQSNIPYEKKTVVLGGNMVGERNILTQDMLLSEDTKYIIRWAFDLDAKTVIMPAGSSLEFNGGSINNGTIVLNDTPVYPSYSMLTSGSHLTIEGNPSVGTYNYTDGMPVWWNGSEWKRGADLSEEVEQMQEDIENLQINLENFNPAHSRPIVVPVADEEDITVDESTNTHKFKDKEYDPANYSGLGRVYLRKNITQIPKTSLANGSWLSYQAGTYLYLLYWYNGTMYNCHKTGNYGLVIGAGQVAEEIADYRVDLLPDYAQGNSLEYTITNNLITITLPDETTIAGSSIHDIIVYEYWENVDDINLLTQEMISGSNTIYIIQYDFTLDENVTVPANCVLEFDGGSISGNVLYGNDIRVFGNVKIAKYKGTFYLGNSDEKVYHDLADINISVISTQEELDNAIVSTEENKNYVLMGKTFRLEHWEVPHNVSINGVKGASVEYMNTSNRYSPTDADYFYDTYYRCPLKKSINIMSVFINSGNDKLIPLTQYSCAITNSTHIVYSDGLLKINKASLSIDDSAIITGYTFGIITHAWYKVPFTVTNKDQSWLYCTPVIWNNNISATYNIDRGIAQEVTLYNIATDNPKSIRYDEDYIYISNEINELNIIDPSDTDSEQDKYLFYFKGSASVSNLTIKNAPLGITNPKNNNAQYVINICNCEFVNVTRPINIRSHTGDYVTSSIIKECLFYNCALGGCYLNGEWGRSYRVVVFFDVWAAQQANQRYTSSMTFSHNKIVNDDILYYPSDSATTSINGCCDILYNEFINFPYSSGWYQYGEINFKYNTLYYTNKFIKEDKQLPFDAGFVYAGQIWNYNNELAAAYDKYFNVEWNTFYGYYSKNKRQVRGIYIDDGRTNVRCTCNKILSIFDFSIDSRDVQNAHENYTMSSHNVKLWGNVIESPAKLQIGVDATGASFAFNLNLTSAKNILEVAEGSSFTFSPNYKHTFSYKIVGNDVLLIDKIFFDSVFNPYGYANAMKPMFVFVDGLNAINSLDALDNANRYEPGFACYATDLKRQVYSDGSIWRDYDGANSLIRRYGTFAQKPGAGSIYIGFQYLCTDKQTTEGATLGIMIYHKGSGVWVDALGRVVS